jgi:hypothetical protein
MLSEAGAALCRKEFGAITTSELGSILPGFIIPFSTDFNIYFPTFFCQGFFSQGINSAVQELSLSVLLLVKLSKITPLQHLTHCQPIPGSQPTCSQPVHLPMPGKEVRKRWERTAQARPWDAFGNPLLKSNKRVVLICHKPP